MKKGIISDVFYGIVKYSQKLKNHGYKKEGLTDKADRMIILQNSNKRLEIPVMLKKEVIIGISSDNDLGLSNDGLLTENYFSLWYDQGRFWIRKLDIENILKINGRELQKEEIRVIFNHAVLEIDNLLYQFVEPS